MNQNHMQKQQTKQMIKTSKEGPKILFLGSGSSTGCPKPICSLLFPPHSQSATDNTDTPSRLTTLQNQMKDKCNVSKLASMGNPIYNKNYRNNPSILISHSNHSNQNKKGGGASGGDGVGKDVVEYKNIIIDVGKTFREGAIRWLPHHSIYSIDAIVLTHEHADAMLGLDDLRGFQTRPYVLMNKETKTSKLENGGSTSLPVFLSPLCLKRVKEQFDYLVPPEDSQDSNLDKDCCAPNDNTSTCNDNDSNMKQNSSLATPKPNVKRAVASLKFNTIHHFKPFTAGGLKMTPLPVMHGEDFICNGYAFSIQNSEEENEEMKDNSHDSKQRNMTNVVYLSDISRMIPETEDFILNELPQPTHILVVDSLNVKGEHPVHFSLEEALKIVERIKPHQTYIVGMNCDNFPDHDAANEMLKEWNHPTVQLAHDGLVIEL